MVLGHFFVGDNQRFDVVLLVAGPAGAWVVFLEQLALVDVVDVVYNCPIQIWNLRKKKL